MSTLSRRGFLKGLGIGLGAAAGARLPGASWMGEARAADEPTSVVILHMIGGYNAIWGSAASLVGKFGVTANNYDDLGNGVSVDNIYASSMSPFVKSHMAVVGVRHGISNHPGAHVALWTHERQNAGLVLANAMGGDAPIKAAVVGKNLIPKVFPSGAVNGVSFQSITDTATTVAALGGGTPNGTTPDRELAAIGVEAAQKMSANTLAGSPGSLASLGNGYGTAVDTLKLPAKSFDVAALRGAYGLGAGTAVTTFASRLAAAELMVRAGTNVVTVFDGGWDTHGNVSASKERTMMRERIGSLNTFLSRTVQDPGRNVVVFIMGDFSRALDGESGHQPNLSATVIGKYVKQGTTGRTARGTVSLPPGTPSIAGMWSLLGALAKGPNPFGKNQHPSLVAA